MRMLKFSVSSLVRGLLLTGAAVVNNLERRKLRGKFRLSLF